MSKKPTYTFGPPPLRDKAFYAEPPQPTPGGGTLWERKKIADYLRKRFRGGPFHVLGLDAADKIESGEYENAENQPQR
jgi:hypothetical protein